jgi:hypothetical protein
MNRFEPNKSRIGVSTLASVPHPQGTLSQELRLPVTSCAGIEAHMPALQPGVAVNA